MPPAAPLTTPASYASPELRVMVVWVVGQRLIMWGPRIAAPPQVAASGHATCKVGICENLHALAPFAEESNTPPATCE
eukprot:3535407-Alexandrium_andersonii.AAC.1